MDKNIGFIGAGQMAEALAKGFIAKGIVPKDRIHAADPMPARQAVFHGLGATTQDSGREVMKNSDVVFLAVKPQYVAEVLEDIRSEIRERHIVVSIAAGITLDMMLEVCGHDTHLIRVMPNTPCLVGATAAAMCLGGAATPDDASIVRQLFESVGQISQVDEKLLAAVTGLSGSGPAYIFLVIEAMADGGVKAGLPRDIAMKLATQTVLGSAKMALETGIHPGALKDMVTSPAGTTIAGVHELEKAGIRGAFISAIATAAQRADELGKLYKK
eukprot:evm.model.scf_1337.1 EVM.evm.TU.scf_1337.1   scf_1337:852-7045(+)